MNRNTLLKRLREHHEWLKDETQYHGNPYVGVAEGMADEARYETRKRALEEFESTFGSVLGIKKG